MKDDRESGLENAWKIYGSLAEWIGRVDAKASFALTIESATLAAVIAFTSSTHRFQHRIRMLDLVVFWSGIGALVLASLASVWVVMPHLRGSSFLEEWPSNFIYFGHLKHWDPKQLQERLKRDDILPALSRQIIVLSMIAWTKHKRVQLSLFLAVLGVSLIGLSALLI